VKTRGYKTKEGEPHKETSGQEQHHGKNVNYSPIGKNPGDFWDITTQPFPKAHFAVYPEELCEKPIKSSCPPKVCARCGSPYERIVEPSGEYKQLKESWRGNWHPEPNKEQEQGASKGWGKDKPRVTASYETKGWRRTCGCETDETKPGIVLDPMAGSGTTGLVAKKLGRDFVLIELNPDYVEMAEERIQKA